MLVLKVMRNKGELYRREVAAMEALEKTHRFLVDDDFLFIPMSRALSEKELMELDSRVTAEHGNNSGHLSTKTCPMTRVGVQLGPCQEKSLKDICCVQLERHMPEREFIRKMPQQRITERLMEKGFPEELLSLVPKRWERFGNILVLRFNERAREYEKLMADAFMQVLGVVSVYADERGIEGELRVPGLRPIAGTEKTTTHIENGIEYRFDVTKIMFSSGNIDERVRFSRIGAAGETVVDMFAGIGYFTLPLAVYGSPARIYAIEKNPESFSFLEKNVAANGVGDVVVPVQGDNREVGPTRIAHRVIMGYIPTPRIFLPRAMDFLGPEGGIIHYHYTCKKDEIHTLAGDHFREMVSTKKREFRIGNIKVIKSYAPMVYHCVADVRVLSCVPGTG